MKRIIRRTRMEIQADLNDQQLKLLTTALGEKFANSATDLVTMIDELPTTVPGYGQLLSYQSRLLDSEDLSWRDLYYLCVEMYSATQEIFDVASEIVAQMAELVVIGETINELHLPAEMLPVLHHALGYEDSAEYGPLDEEAQQEHEDCINDAELLCQDQITHVVTGDKCSHGDNWDDCPDCRH